MKRVISVTRRLFLLTQIAAIVWVSWSYLLATYALVVLRELEPLMELSQDVVNVILGVAALKVLGNIFEHNNGPVFGTSTKEPKNKKIDF